MIKEFRDFLMRGNVVDLAVAVVIGGAVRAADRLGGHLVQGNGDGVGTVAAVAQGGDGRLVDRALPADVAELQVPHGAIALDGVSSLDDRRRAICDC